MPTNTFFYFLFAVLTAFILFELIASLPQHSIRKKIAIILISVLLIGWLDIFSLFLLTTYATFIILSVKYFPDIIKNTLIFVVINIFLLIFIKDYYLVFDIKQLYVPLGVSYYFFRLISFVIEHNKNPETYRQTSYLDYYLYVYFFPIFLAGPIQRFNDFYFLKKPLIGLERLKAYNYLVFVLFIKIFLIDTIMLTIAYKKFFPIIKTELVHHVLTHHLFFFGFTAFLHAYLDLMIYTEISKTLATLLGFSKQENFNRPLLATNISRFWQTWHMSLSNWTRDYVFFPTLIKTKKVWFSTYASMMVIGIWHSISLNWIFWAFMHGSALNFYLWLRTTEFYKAIIAHDIMKKVLIFTGNFVTIFFVSTIFIVVATHDSSIVSNLLETLFIYMTKGIS